MVVPNDQEFDKMIELLVDLDNFKISTKTICAGCYQPMNEVKYWDDLKIDPLCSSQCKTVLKSRGLTRFTFSGSIEYDRCLRQCYLHYFKRHWGSHKYYNDEGVVNPQTN